jgi:hypothetical protein
MLSAAAEAVEGHRKVRALAGDRGRKTRNQGFYARSRTRR